MTTLFDVISSTTFRKVLFALYYQHKKAKQQTLRKRRTSLYTICYVLTIVFTSTLLRKDLTLCTNIACSEIPYNEL
jgi:hypothetical protein